MPWPTACAVGPRRAVADRMARRATACRGRQVDVRTLDGSSLAMAVWLRLGGPAVLAAPDPGDYA